MFTMFVIHLQMIFWNE